MASTLSTRRLLDWLISTQVFVIDCDGFGRRHLGEVRIFKRCAAALKVLHPERQRKTFIVRAPRVFAVFWKIVRVCVEIKVRASWSPDSLVDFHTGQSVPRRAHHLQDLYIGCER